MFCKNCGVELAETDRFCPSCGERVKSDNANGPSSGVVRIKLAKFFGIIFKQSVSIMDVNGQLLWKGNAGDIAEIYFEGQTHILIKYHTAGNAWGGIGRGIVDPSIGTSYVTSIRRGIFETLISFERVDFID